MADITPNYIRGFLVPFPFTVDNFWSAESSLTQNGSLAGIPESTSNPSLVLTSKGSQDSEVYVSTARSGHIQDGAGFAWKYSSDTNYYGAEVPNKVTDVQMLESGASVDSFTPRHSIRATSGTIFVCYEHVTATQNKIEVATIAADGTYSSQVVSAVDSSGLSGEKRFGTLYELPDGSIMLHFWEIDAVKEVANVVGYRSSDDGATWVLVSSKCLPSDVDISFTFGAGAAGFELQPLRAASSASQVLLIVALNAHDTSLARASVVYQYASTNRGLTYKYIDKTDTSGSDFFYYPDLVQFNGVFILSYFSSVDSLDFMHLSNAFDSMFDKLGIIPADTLSGAFCNTSANRLIDGDKTMYLDTDGRLYVYVMKTTKIQMHGAYSDLAGIGVDTYAANWNLFGDKSSMSNVQVILTDSPSPKTVGGVKNIIGVAGQGSQHIFCNWENKGTNALANYLHMLNLGIWSTQQYPRMQPFPDDNQWGYNLQDWLPFDQPDQGTVWTKNVTGSPTATLGGDHISLVCTGLQILNYEIGVSDNSNGCLIQCRVSNISGSQANNGTAFGVQIQTQSSTDTYYAEVVITDNDIYLFDVHAGYGSAVASITNMTISDGINILFFLDNSSGDVYVYACDSGSPRQYESISGTLTTNPSTTQKIYWGIASAPLLGSDRSSDWHFFSYGLGAANGVGWSNGDINARLYSARGFSTQIKDGLSISTLDGAAREGDLYTIAPQYTSPIERTLHTVSPSPRVGWRSDAVANPDTTAVGSQTIAWVMDTTLLSAANTHTETEASGIHLTGINFKQFAIQKYVAGSGWTSVATVNNSFGGGSFNFTRTGAAVFSTAANGKYLALGEATGWSILLDDGAGNVVQRRIKSNGEGVLANTSSKKAYLTLKGVQNSDPTSGTATLIPSSCTVLFPENEYAGLRIVITSQKTAEGYFEIGTMVMGCVVIPMHQYSRGRTIAFEANTIENQTPNGTLYARKRGTGGRSVRISWQDGVDTSQLWANQAAPDYTVLFPSDVIAAQNSAPMTMIGLVEYMQGSRDALVYLPSIETGSGGSYLIYDTAYSHMLCTLGNDVSIENVVGDELQTDQTGEVFRVGTLTLREVR